MAHYFAYLANRLVFLPMQNKEPGRNFYTYRFWGGFLVAALGGILVCTCVSSSSSTIAVRSHAKMLIDRVN